MNKIRQQIQEEPASAPAKNSSQSASQRLIRAVNVFSYFDRTLVVRTMPYLFFLFLLALIYIGNSYYAERTIRDIDKATRDIKELHSEFITTKSELMSRSKLTEVARSIKPTGVEESTVAPRKIVVRKPRD